MVPASFVQVFKSSALNRTGFVRRLYEPFKNFGQLFFELQPFGIFVFEIIADR